jgi:hypothetical protein
MWLSHYSSSEYALEITELGVYYAKIYNWIVVLKTAETTFFTFHSLINHNLILVFFLHSLQLERTALIFPIFNIHLWLINWLARYDLKICSSILSIHKIWFQFRSLQLWKRNSCKNTEMSQSTYNAVLVSASLRNWSYFFFLIHNSRRFDWLIICCFTSPSRIFNLYGEVTIVGERLQNVGPCLGSLSREGSLSYHTCCDTGPRFFRSHPKDRPI